MTSLKINTLVFQHLKKVTPNLASEFKSRNKCFSIDLNITLEEIFKIVVYEHMLNVTPALATKFHRKHMVSLNSSEAIEFQVFTLSEEDIVDVASGSESSSSESDNDSDIIANDNNYENVIPPKDCNTPQVITLSEKEIIDVTSNSESSSCESDSDSEIDVSPKETIDVTSDSESSSSEADSDADADIVILKEVNPSKECEFNQDYTNKLNAEDEKLFNQALEEQFNCVVTSSSESDTDSETNDADVIHSHCVIKKLAVTKSQINKIKPTSKINLEKCILDKPKHSILDENMNEVGFILDCPEYCDLKKVLKEDSIVDKIVLHIINENIKITQPNLENVILTRSRLNKSRVHKSHGDTCGVKLGGFTTQEMGIILSNWRTLVTEMNIKNPEETFEMFCKRLNRNDKLKANVLGLYLSQGLPKLRLAADVFHHSEDKILARPSGNISKEEHDEILDYVSKHGESSQTFKDLAVLLNRGFQSQLSIRRYYIKETQQKMLKNGKYTMDENKMFIKGLVSAYNIESVQQIKTLNYGDIILNEIFIELAKNLGRSVFNLSNHWEVYTKSLLLQYHAGTINCDVKRILANHLLEKNLTFVQDISWNELLAFPQFAGHTRRSLAGILNDLIRSTQNKLQCTREEVTIEMVAEHVNDRFNPHKLSKKVNQNSAQRLELANYYKSLVEKKNSL